MKTELTQVCLKKSHLPDFEVPHVFEIQKVEFEKFLQKDIPMHDREDCGIHLALKEIFGLVDTHDIIINELPNNTILKELSKIFHKPILDIKAAILGKIPVVRSIKDIFPIKKLLEECNTNSSILPSGLRVVEKNTTVTLQYKDYKLKGPEEVEDDSQFFYLTQKAGVESPRTSCRFKGTSYVYKLFIDFRVIVEKPNKDPIICDDTMYFTNIPAMTKDATFFINGTPRAVISTLNRFAGVSFREDKTKGYTNGGRRAFIATIDSDDVFNHKTITFFLSKDDTLYVSIGGSKLTATDFLRALGVTDDQISKFFENDLDVFPDLNNKDQEKMCVESLTKVVKNIFKVAFVNKEIAASILYSYLTNFRVGPIGRFLINQKFNNIYLESEFGKRPEQLSLSIVDILLTTKYLLELCSGRGKEYVDDDTLSLGRRYVKTIRGLLEEIFFSSLDKISKTTTAKVRDVLLKKGD